MEVKINDDIQTFGKEISYRGWVCALLAGGAGMILYWTIGRVYMPPSFQGIPSMLVATPFLLIGFVRVQNMPFEGWLKNMLNTLVFRRCRRVYRAENAYLNLQASVLKQEKKERCKYAKRNISNQS